MNTTTIEWAERTWNPVTGCSPISEGCENCYAKRMAQRLRGRCGYPEDEPFKVTLHSKRLEEPLRLRRPSRIFVCSMGDLFHEDVPDTFIDRVFATMALAAHQTFLILTKRPERMLKWFNRFAESEESVLGDSHIGAWLNSVSGNLMADTGTLPGGKENWQWVPPEYDYHEPWRVANPGYYDWVGKGSMDAVIPWPLPNVWLGVTAENQARADERIPILLQTPAVVRGVSVEPMLGPVDLTAVQLDKYTHMNVLEGCGVTTRPGYMGQSLPNCHCERIDWVICGGETGPGARPMHPDWVRLLRDQCQAAGVPFLFKQWGEWAPIHELRCGEPGIKGRWWFNFDPDTTVCKVGKKRSGRLLDGRIWDEYPGVMT
jgi:protein gp37